MSLINNLRNNYLHVGKNMNRGLTAIPLRLIKKSIHLFNETGLSRAPISAAYVCFVNVTYIVPAQEQ